MIKSDDYKMNNIITIAELPADKYSFDDLKQISGLLRCGRRLEELDACKVLGKFKNLVMDTRLEEINSYLFNRATKLLITSNTDAPVGTEVTPTSGIIYTATQNLITGRTEGNPYYLSFAVMSDNANSEWGSLVFTDSSDLIINRVLTPGVTKVSSKVMFIELQSTITS